MNKQKFIDIIAQELENDFAAISMKISGVVGNLSNQYDVLLYTSLNYQYCVEVYLYFRDFDNPWITIEVFRPKDFSLGVGFYANEKSDLVKNYRLFPSLKAELDKINMISCVESLIDVITDAYSASTQTQHTQP